MLKLDWLDGSGKSLWLVGPELRIGANAQNQLRLQGRGVDEFHAHIAVDGESLRLHSKAGTCFVNNLPVDAEYGLRAGDELRIGTHCLRVVDPKQVLAKEIAAVLMPPVWRLDIEHPQVRDRYIEVRNALRVGSAASCEVIIPYKLLAPQHVELVPQRDGLLLRDLGSEHGTFINGNRIGEALAVAGDTIHLARLPFALYRVQ